MHVNVPAIATAGVPDALGREPGMAVVCALGRDLDGFLEIKRAVGSRAWAALYLGAPSTDEGSLIRSEWLDSHRLPGGAGPPDADGRGRRPCGFSGEGDATGIIGASLAPDGTVCLIADVCAQLTSRRVGEPGRGAGDHLGASAIVVEGFSRGDDVLPA